ncbi:TonB-dependent receptor domain-containing protein [Marinospirillum perlucidum]|uniref:TonB-dependent receptor domain-containing protein n=1 Tax=Marinospirillum perlucidum TaxID=1982602 RepID=UPI000DF3B92A|nr:TonB-dependent receptor [Marinospirillum perlucidum]
MNSLSFARHPLTLGLASFLISTAVQAEDLPPLQVTGQPLGEVTSRTLTPETSISPAADAGDWLQQQPGIDAVRMGGHGLDPIIRGLGQNRVNILLDGAYVFGGCPNRMDPPTAYAPLHSYDRIVIEKGVSTLKNGPGGSGGSVSFERDRPEFLPGDPLYRGEVGGRYASNGDEIKAWAQVTAGGQQGYLRTFAEYSEADHYEDGSGREIWSGYESTQGGLLLGWTPNEATWLEVSYEETRERDVHFAGAGMDSPESDNRTLGLRGEYQSSPLLTLSGNLHLSEIDHLMDSYSLRPDATMKMKAPTESDTLTGRLMAEYQLGENQVTTGINLMQNQRSALLQTAMDQEIAYLWPEVEQTAVGAFAEIEHRLGQEGRAFAGVRLDQVTSSADQTAIKPTGFPWTLSADQLYQDVYGFTGDTDREDWLTGAFLRYEQDLGSWQKAFISASRSQRSGDASELYMARVTNMGKARWAGNPDLDLETSHQLDLGLAGKSRSLDYSAVLFGNWISDYIYRDQQTLSGKTNDFYRNISARLYGIELEASLRYAGNWETRGHFFAQRGNNETDGGTLAGIPAYQGQIAQHWQADSWQLIARMDFALEQDRLNAPAGEVATDAYTVLGLEAHWQPQENLLVAVGVDNLLDEDYANFINRNAAGSDPLNFGGTAYTDTLTEPGRSIWVSARYQF